MRGAITDTQEAHIAERARLGLDRYDEMWDGVLHMAPWPDNPHQRLVAVFIRALWDAAEVAGLEVRDGVNVCHPERTSRDYRVPDVVVVDADPRWVVRDRFGVHGGVHWAVEIRSKGDEAYRKVPFYAERGVRTLVIVDPFSATVHRYELQADGTYAVTSSAGPLDVGFGITITMEAEQCVAVSCPAGTWRA